MLKFPAQLTRDVYYCDFNGNEVKVPAGSRVDITMVEQCESISAETSLVAPPEDQLFATQDDVSFDVSAEEFEEINQC